MASGASDSTQSQENTVNTAMEVGSKSSISWQIGSDLSSLQLTHVDEAPA